MFLFSLAIVLLVIVPIFIEISRGINRGGVKTSVTFGVIVLSMLSSLISTAFVADIFARGIVGDLIVVDGYALIREQFPSIDTIATAYAEALVTPILFLLFFWIWRALFALLTRLLYRTVLKNPKNDAGYEGKNNRWYWRHPQKSGALIGAMCGLITAVMVISPLLGTLDVATKAINIVEDNESFIQDFSLNTEELQILGDCAEAPAVKIIYSMGGRTVYGALARSSIKGEGVVLLKEIDYIAATMKMLGKVVGVLNATESITDERVDEITELLKDVSISPTFKLLAADFLSSASKAWLAGDKYMGIEKIAAGELFEPLVTEMLTVCTTATTETVSDDMTTILNVILLAVKSDLMTSTDYEAVLKKLNDEHILTRLCDELEENYRMAYIADSVRELSLKTVAFLIKYSEYTDDGYDRLTVVISDSLNSLKNHKYDERIEMMSQGIVEHIENVIGISVPIDVARTMAEAMEETLSPADGVVRPSDITWFIDSYAR